MATSRDTATLDRAAFCGSQLLDFCSHKELIVQTGRCETDWPLVALKGLVDNALDACEDADIEPTVDINVNHHVIAITDTGLVIFALADGTLKPAPLHLLCLVLA